MTTINTTDVQTALANEARRQEIKQKIARLQGTVDATASAVQRLNSVNNDSQIQLQQLQSELTALELGAGPGITSDFGPKSVVTRLVENERQAAKEATIDFIKANPECTEADAVQVWNQTALASHPEFPYVIQGGEAMSALYRENMVRAGAIQEGTWEAQRTFILNTDKATIEAM